MSHSYPGSRSPELSRAAESEEKRLPSRSAHQGDAIPVAVARATRFDGLVSFRGAARIDGCLSGEVSATGMLWLGPEARVEAKVEVDELVVEGQLRGDVVARERVTLLPSARVEGDLTAPRIAVRDGSRIVGRCTVLGAADRCGKLS